MTESSYDVVIVGGGVIGSSTAYFLASQPDFDGRIAVIEKDSTYTDAATPPTMTTSYVPSVMFYSAIKFRIEQAFDARLAHKQTSGQRRLAQLIRIQSVAGAGDE